MARIEPRIYRFDQMIEDVRKGILRVPRFQRGFVWRRDQVLELFTSIRLRYPIGSLLIWRTRDRYNSFDKLGPIPVPPDQPVAPAEVGYVLDGHQRLSALFGVLALSDEEAERLRGSERIFLVYYDLKDEKFCHARFPKAYHLPVRYLLSRGDEFTTWIDERRDRTEPGSATRLEWDTWRRRAFTLQTSFAQYQLSYIDVTDASLDEAVNIFWRLNSQGSRVSRTEVFAALTWSEGAFDFTRSATELLQEYPAFDNFGTEPILRAFLASLGENIYADDWAAVLKRHEGELPLAMQSTREAFGRAVRFMDETIGASSGRVVPYALQLVLLTEFFRCSPEASPAARGRLVEWLWASSFSAAYSLGGSATFEDAISRARRLAAGEDLPLLPGHSVFLRAFPRRFHPKSARVRAFHLFLKSLQPRDLRSGDLLINMLANGMADARPVVTRDRSAWRLASRVLVGTGRRDILGDLEKLPLHPMCDEVLASHLISREALEALLAGHEERFLELREETLMQREREFARRFVEIPTDQNELVEEEPEIDVEEHPESEFSL